MTDRPRPIPVAAIAGGLFCLILIYLALQIRAGSDPAIGEGFAAAQAPRQVIVRRVIVRRIVEEGAPASGSAPAAAGSGAIGGGGGGGAAPAAPAPAAPAPAPAPAPVVSGGS